MSFLRSRGGAPPLPPFLSRARSAFSILLERIKGGNTASEIARMEYGHMLLERRSTAPNRASDAGKN